MATLRIDNKEINIAHVIGQRMRFIRQQTCSQQEMADMLVENSKSLQSYELGYRTVSVEVVLKFLVLYRRFWQSGNVSLAFWTASASSKEVVWKDFLFYVLGFMPSQRVPLFEANLIQALVPVRSLFRKAGKSTYGLDAIDTSWASDYVIEFPRWIKRYRKDYRLSRVKFAPQVGAVPGSLKYWENGYNLLSIHAWLRIILTTSEDLLGVVVTLTNTETPLHIIERALQQLTFGNIGRLERYLVTGEVA